MRSQVSQGNSCAYSVENWIVQSAKHVGSIILARRTKAEQCHHLSREITTGKVGCLAVSCDTVATQMRMLWIVSTSLAG